MVIKLDIMDYKFVNILEIFEMKEVFIMMNKYYKVGYVFVEVVIIGLINDLMILGNWFLDCV